MEIDTGSLLELGIGITAAIVILKMVFDSVIKPLLDKLTGNGKKDPLVELEKCREAMRETQRQIEDLYNWHNVRNQDGVPVWYVPSALEKAIQALAINIDAQTNVLRGVADIQRDTCAFMDRLERSLTKAKEKSNDS